MRNISRVFGAGIITVAMLAGADALPAVQALAQVQSHRSAPQAHYRAPQAHYRAPQAHWR